MTYEVFMGITYKTKGQLLGTQLELIMADGLRTKPLGVVKNMMVEVNGNAIPVDIFITKEKSE